MRIANESKSLSREFERVDDRNLNLHGLSRSAAFGKAGKRAYSFEGEGNFDWDGDLSSEDLSILFILDLFTRNVRQYIKFMRIVLAANTLLSRSAFKTLVSSAIVFSNEGLSCYAHA